MAWFFTADEHYFHKNIINVCGRPFDSMEDMHDCLIQHNNGVVGSGDVVVHVGDFCWAGKPQAGSIIKRLSGGHIFLRGNHDGWLPKAHRALWEKTICGQPIVALHYAMRTWNRSHYGSWQIHGHSHGTLAPYGLQYDVGVDNNNYRPVSFDELALIMSELKKQCEDYHSDSKE